MVSSFPKTIIEATDFFFYIFLSKVVVNGEAEGERPRHMSTSSDNSSSEGSSLSLSLSLSQLDGMRNRLDGEMLR